MKEIHHRVKNNLQIVMSLLRSQSSNLTNEEAFEAIQKSQHRLYAISLLHQKLYMTDIVREIEMKNYIDDLLENFVDTFGLYGRIDFSVDIDRVYLHETQAISVGLILNEAVTNAIKYAFPEQSKGTITIMMKANCLKTILEISDNGIGLSVDFDIDTASTLGTTLIKGLAEQLDGDVSFVNTNGLTVRVAFSKGIITTQ
nr:sensor histidine kinase [Flavobacterium potami]